MPNKTFNLANKNTFAGTSPFAFFVPTLRAGYHKNCKQVGPVNSALYAHMKDLDFFAKIMIKFICLLPILETIGCSSTPREDEFKEEYKRIDNSVVYDKAMAIMMSPYLKSRGSATLCTQDLYLGCYKMSSSQCRERFSPWSLECSELAKINNSFEMFFGKKGYLERFIGCMEVKHDEFLDLSDDESEKIKECKSHGIYDNAKSFRAIFDIR